MTPRSPLRPICLLGPPASGKTTLSQHLSRALDAPVYRPRGLINRTINRQPALLGLFPRDDRGDVPDDALGFALRTILGHLDGTVVLENLPWNPLQLADLFQLAGDRVVILNLCAPDDVVIQRRALRTHCTQCYPCATQSVDDRVCGMCGSTLTMRADDELASFIERLQLRRDSTSRILRLAANLGIAVVSLDAEQPIATLIDETLQRLVAT